MQLFSIDRIQLMGREKYTRRSEALAVWGWYWLNEIRCEKYNTRDLGRCCKRYRELVEGRKEAMRRRMRYTRM